MCIIKTNSSAQKKDLGVAKGCGSEHQSKAQEWEVDHRPSCHCSAGAWDIVGEQIAFWGTSRKSRPD